MADIQFLRIDDKWALAYDSRQWVLQRSKGICKSGQEEWKAVSFVAYDKSALARCMREKGVSTEVAMKAIATLPDAFPEFLRALEVDSGRLEVVYSASEPLDVSECHPIPKRAVPVAVS